MERSIKEGLKKGKQSDERERKEANNTSNAVEDAQITEKKSLVAKGEGVVIIKGDGGQEAASTEGGVGEGDGVVHVLVAHHLEARGVGPVVG